MHKPDTTVTIPRMSGKRLATTMAALKMVKEGKSVAIVDIGGVNKVLEPLEDGNVLIREVKKDDQGSVYSLTCSEILSKRTWRAD